MTKTTGLNFIEAVQMAKETGRRIRRASWSPNISWGFDSDSLRYFRGGQKTDEGILANFSNLSAEDWVIVPDPPKTMTFQEAVEAMRNGKVVQRLNPSYYTCYAYRQDEMSDFQVLHLPTGNVMGRASFYVTDFEATDWVIVEEGQS